jgi:hypothetical protein
MSYSSQDGKTEVSGGRGDAATPAGQPLAERGLGAAQRLHPGFELVLHRDEAEGYYLNVSVPGARVFVLWRLEGDQGLPLDVTASYNEGGRWLDGGNSVEGVAMPAEVYAWVGEYVEQNYRPEPRKRIKPRSFVHPKNRAG